MRLETAEVKKRKGRSFILYPQETLFEGTTRTSNKNYGNGEYIEQKPKTRKLLLFPEEAEGQFNKEARADK
jgi:hypothetical protein